MAAQFILLAMRGTGTVQKLLVSKQVYSVSLGTKCEFLSILKKPFCIMLTK